MNDREQRNNFTETLREVAQIVRTLPEKPDRDEILGYFKDIQLTDEQKDMVFEYLLTAPDEAENEQAETAGDADSRMQEEDTQTAGSGNGDMEISKALKLYLEDISGVCEYTDEEKEQLYRELLDGDNEVIVKISESMLRDVAVLADEYATDKAALEDLIQEGNLAAFVRLTELCGMGAGCGYDVEEEVNEAVNNAMEAYVSDATGEADIENTVVGKANLVSEAQKLLRK